MSAGCMRWILSQAVRSMCGNCLVYRIPASRFRMCTERHNTTGAFWRGSPFSTEAFEPEQTPETKEKKLAIRTNIPISSVGRKIPQREVQVFDENGKDLGTLHRAEVIRIMNEKDMKLVLLSENRDPPIYQLMTGKQIYEEQLKQREKKKPAEVQVKALTFSRDIASHDINTKKKQLENWLEKKHHIKITLRSASKDPDTNLVTALEQILNQMDLMVGFISKPQAIRDGRAAMCVLRPPSAKELLQMKKAAKSPNTSETNTSSVCSTNTTEELS